ncbi:cupin domain-containing protein [Brevundimonas sp.]|uniref:cupin domain-containing protein n=1 Tax=Brevundimonas sp. TaxID=1871086 RepID=UPI00391D66DF
MQTAFDGDMHAPFANTPLEQRIVRFADLIPCTTAFIDARTPGSDAKENFTIIGPGVAENPDQHVHIREPHGFNIGGARQPPGCVNSQHFHETAEVFFVHSGRWAFRTGEYADEGEVILSPGDTISIPVHVFRGFENVGRETGFLYAVLGGDDPGRVVWAPDVLERAKGHGLVLLQSGRLVDTLKNPPPDSNDPVVLPESRSELKRVVRHVDSQALEAFVVRDNASTGQVLSAGAGFGEHVVIGPENMREPAPAAPLDWPHGFVCRRVRLVAGASGSPVRRAEPEVIFVHSGELEIAVDGERSVLSVGDTVTVPVGAARTLFSSSGADLFVTRGSDAPLPAKPLEDLAG